MAVKPVSDSDIRNFWNQRAELGQRAGSDDVIAKHLEVAAISSYIKDGMRILELGCGNGQTALEIARRYAVDILAFDFAEKMVQQANALANEQKLRGSVKFEVRDIAGLGGISVSERFDLIYTERVLINLPDFAAQQRAIESIVNLLRDGGLYVMCENSQVGLDQINAWREHAGLPRIVPPWHNRYFKDSELEGLSIPGVRLEQVNDYSGTYYFLSRVVNAAIAAGEGKPVRYDSPINELALRLPPLGQFGQGRIWLWRKLSGPVQGGLASGA